jgi:hypothetical protein
MLTRWWLFRPAFSEKWRPVYPLLTKFQSRLTTNPDHKSRGLLRPVQERPGTQHVAQGIKSVVIREILIGVQGESTIRASP